MGKKRNLKKVTSCKKELEKLKYEIHPIRFGQDNTTTQLIGNVFTQNMMVMRSANEKMAEIMYELSKSEITTNIELYDTMKNDRNEETNRAYLTKRHWKILCKANYFNDNNKKLMNLIPYLYDKVYTKKQFRLASLDKLKSDLKVTFDIMPYCTRKTPKTYYLDETKKIQLVEDLYKMVAYEDFTIRETAENMIEVYGFIPEDPIYKENNIYTVEVEAVSRKNSSVMVKTASGKTTWVKIKGDITQIKKNQSITVFGMMLVMGRFNKPESMISDFISY